MVAEKASRQKPAGNNALAKVRAGHCNLISSNMGSVVKGWTFTIEL